MTKRAAMLMAAGVVLALFGGSVALSFGLAGDRTAQAGSNASEPIVRTIHRTIRVEKQAQASPMTVVTLQAPASPEPSSWDDRSDDARDEREDEWDELEDEREDREDDREDEREDREDDREDDERWDDD
jgi:hypothetical protein